MLSVRGCFFPHREPINRRKHPTKLCYFYRGFSVITLFDAKALFRSTIGYPALRMKSEAPNRLSNLELKP